MRPIDADALIEKCGGWYVEEGTESGFIGTLKNLLSTMPTIQQEKAQLSQEGTTSDLISRTETVEKIQVGITATNSNDAYSLGMRNGMRWCKSLIDGAEPKFEYGATRVDDGTDSAELPPAQPEPTDIDAKEAVYNLAEKIGIHQLFALTVELRGEPIQPEPHEGHWIGSDGSYICSECNGSPIDFIETMGDSFDAYMETPMPYCPNCGAKMTILTK